MLNSTSVPGKNKGSIMIIFVGIVLLFAFLITYFVGKRIANNNLQNESKASGTIQLPEEDESSSNVLNQTVTSMPLPAIEKTDESEISPGECQAQGGLCIYDLSCNDFGMVKSGVCYGKRPNDMTVDCCKSQKNL